MADDRHGADDLDGALDLGAVRRAVARQLDDAGIESSALDARLLIGHALGLTHTALVTSSDRVLTASERAAIAQLVARRVTGEPVARIIGEKEFWGLPFKLSAATLVPRPDTETIVEAALAVFDAQHHRNAPLLIADLGTGPGTILLALLHECPNAFGIGTDCSIEAITTARANASALGLSQRAAWAIMDFGAALGAGFDLIVSNPPYIPTADIETLDREVREHDPDAALDGGADGLDAYRAIARQAPHLLRDDGAIVVEIGRGQDTDVTSIFESAGAFQLRQQRRDLAGIIRALTFQRRK